MMVDLAAPHTWVASIMPVLFASVLALNVQGTIHVLNLFLLLMICILMQSAVNSFNDYFDYIKGTDTVEDRLEESDSVLVYNDIDPKHVLLYAIILLIMAFLLGIPLIISSGIIPLLIALIGASIVVLYSGGKTPISYLPIGEVVSGFVMGGLIPLACIYVYTANLDPFVLIWSIPIMIGIAMIMMTNNVCDIEKDISASRRTLPILLGRRRAVDAYKACAVFWIVTICILTLIRFIAGWVVLPFLVLLMPTLLIPVFKSKLDAASRIGDMGRICSLNIVLGMFYITSIAL